MPQGAVRIKGLRELQRDFKKMSKELSRELRSELKEAAEPVQRRAEELAFSEIRNMPLSPQWARMRIGVSAKSVYVVPLSRSRGGKGRGRRRRPNLAPLMLERAMDPALEQKQGEVVQRLERMLDRMGTDNGF